VVNLFSTKRIAWADVERFSLAPRPGVWGGCVIRKGGQPSVPLNGFAPSKPATQQYKLEAQRQIDELNAELVLRREGLVRGASADKPR